MEFTQNEWLMFSMDERAKIIGYRGKIGKLCDELKLNEIQGKRLNDKIAELKKVKAEAKTYSENLWKEKNEQTKRDLQEQIRRLQDDLDGISINKRAEALKEARDKKDAEENM